MPDVVLVGGVSVNVLPLRKILNDSMNRAESLRAFSWLNAYEIVLYFIPGANYALHAQRYLIGCTPWSSHYTGCQNTSLHFS